MVVTRFQSGNFNIRSPDRFRSQLSIFRSEVRSRNRMSTRRSAFCSDSANLLALRESF
jgi:hypothetical protein